MTVGEDPPLRYPESLMPEAAQLVERYERFAELREELLLGYGYNTARAYWGDLEHLNDWALERRKDILSLADSDFRQYRALLRRRHYSESTIRRRATALRLLKQQVEFTETQSQKSISEKRRAMD